VTKLSSVIFDVTNLGGDSKISIAGFNDVESIQRKGNTQNSMIMPA
jgi:hypothetical protein